MLKEYISTKQQKSLVTKNIGRYQRPVTTLRSLALSQLDTKGISKINEIKDRLHPPGKLVEKEKQENQQTLRKTGNQ